VEQPLFPRVARRAPGPVRVARVRNVEVKRAMVSHLSAGIRIAWCGKPTRKGAEVPGRSRVAQKANWRGSSESAEVRGRKDSGTPSRNGLCITGRAIPSLWLGSKDALTWAGGPLRRKRKQRWPEDQKDKLTTW